MLSDNNQAETEKMKNTENQSSELQMKIPSKFLCVCVIVCYGDLASACF